MEFVVLLLKTKRSRLSEFLWLIRTIARVTKSGPLFTFDSVPWRSNVVYDLSFFPNLSSLQTVSKSKSAFQLLVVDVNVRAIICVRAFVDASYNNIKCEVYRDGRSKRSSTYGSKQSKR